MSELAWDIYKCKCGGDAMMGIMSLVARCDKCPRVFAQVSMTGGGRWFPDINAANEAWKTENRWTLRSNHLLQIAIRRANNE